MRISLKFLTHCLLSILFTFSVQAEPPNVTLVKQATIAYHDSGQYQKDLEKVINQARAHLIRRSAPWPDKKPKLALILDIDETSLSNYQHIIDRDFSGQKNLLIKEILQADDPAIKPTLDLYNLAKARGVKIFFITGRSEYMRKATVLNLKRAGYKNWAGLYLRPQNYQNSSMVPFKSQTRKAITEQGYQIIANIGDQYSDLKGGYAQKAFKLPNPYYYLP